jgi:tetratricopeptide (TPR) repeat protein
MLSQRYWLFFSIGLLFSITPLFSQDEILVDDEFQVQEDTNCFPESLSVSYDIYANIENAEANVPQWYSFGSEHYKNKNYIKALPYLWKVFLNNDSRRASLSISKIADIYFTQKKIDSTLIACYRGFVKFPDHQKLHYYAGFLQKELGKNSCAIPHYQVLVDSNPENVSYLATLAFLLFKEGQYEKAIEYQQKVVDLSPTDAKTREALAMYIQASGASPKDAFKDAFLKDPANNFDAGRNWAKFAIEEGSYTEALEPLNIIIAKEPKKEDYRSRATAYENLSQFGNAVNDLKSRLALDPNNADIMLSIALDYSSLKNFSTANSWINRALNKRSGYGKAYITRGELYEYMVLYCQEQRGGKIKLEDKIVYELAMDVYAQAKRDLAFKSTAQTKINNLVPFVRTKEEKFMEPDAKITSDCYSFLK